MYNASSSSQVFAQVTWYARLDLSNAITTRRPQSHRDQSDDARSFQDFLCHRAQSCRLRIPQLGLPFHEPPDIRYRSKNVTRLAGSARRWGVLLAGAQNSFASARPGLSMLISSSDRLLTTTLAVPTRRNALFNAQFSKDSGGPARADALRVLLYSGRLGLPLTVRVNSDRPPTGGPQSKRGRGRPRQPRP